MFRLFSRILYGELTAGLTGFQSSQGCCTSLQGFSVFSFSETERLRLKFIRIQLASDRLCKWFQISWAQEKQCCASNTLLLIVLALSRYELWFPKRLWSYPVLQGAMGTLLLTHHNIQKLLCSILVDLCDFCFAMLRYGLLHSSIRH